MTRPSILLIDGAEREAWYAPLVNLIPARWTSGASSRLLDKAAEIDLAVVSDERALPHAVDAVCRLAEQSVPVLHVLDGILEWRNTWENPTFTLASEPATPFLQPSLCHKIACLGRSQARILESWGNLGKCEVVGLPRLDHLVENAGPFAEKNRDKPADEFRLLVVTARTPGFTPEQSATVERSLVDLKKWLDRHPTLAGRAVRATWRLTGELARRIGVDNQLGDVFGGELLDILPHFDAMITTPSTAQLEGMLAGLPVALLDYHNRPHYVEAAWNVTAETHLEQIVHELAEPPAERMLYQDTLLHDSLECRSPAAPRMVRLVDEMIRLGRECRASGRPLELPCCILTDLQDGHHWPESRFDYRELYPDHPVFGRPDQRELQMEVAQLRRVIARQGVLETHPLWGPALRLRRRMKRFFGRIRPGGRDA